MPSIDEQLKTRMREGAPRPAGAAGLFERLGSRKRRRAALRSLELLRPAIFAHVPARLLYVH